MQLAAPERLAPGLLAATLLLAIPALSWDIASYADLPKRTLIQLGVALSAALGLAVGRGPRLQPALAALALFWGVAGLGVLRSADRFEAVEVWLHWTLCCVALWLAQQGPRGRTPWPALLAAAGAITALGCLLRDGGWLATLPGPSPESGFFGNPNWAGQVLLACLPAQAAAWVLAVPGWAPWAWALALACSLAAIPRLGSSAAYVLLLVQLGALALLLLAASRRRRLLGLLRARVPSTLAALALLVALLASGSGGAGALWRGLSEEVGGVASGIRSADAAPGVASTPGSAGTTRDRIASYRAALHLWRERPLLGHGLMSFGALLPEANRQLGGALPLRLNLEQRHVHNDWLQIALELGALGLLALLGFAALLLGPHLAPLLRRREGPDAASLAAGVGLASLAVNALFSFPAFNAVPPLLAAIFAGMLGRGSQGLAAGRWRWVAVALALIACAGLASWRSAVWRSEWHMARLSGAVEQGDWAAVSQHARAVQSGATGRRDHLAHWAQARLALGDPAGALRTVEELLRTHPHSPAGLALSAAIFQSRGELESALRAYEQAQELAPADYRLYLRVAELESRLGRDAQALERLQSGAARTRDPLPLLLEIGRLGYQSGHTDLAIDALRRAVARAPHHARAHARLGLLLIETGSDSRAGREHLGRAVSLDPGLAESPELRRHLGLDPG